jgi:DNA-binding transcriptional MerR regulator
MRYSGFMTTQKTYSLEQLSVASKIPASTVRYYSKNYSQYFPSTRPEGAKNAVFDSECLDVLKTIRKHQKSGLNKAQILSELAKRFSPIYDNNADMATNQQAASEQPSNKQLATTTPQIPNVMQTINQLAEFSDNQVQLTEHYRKQNEQQRQLIDELSEKVGKLEREASELKEENKKLQPKKGWWR